MEQARMFAKGSHVYNRSLMASVIAAHGEAVATQWGEGLVANMARRPQGNDRAQAKAIFEGQCDIAVMNHYYYGKMLHGEKAEQRDWANAIRLVFTNQDNRGAHVNISGGGVAKHSPNRDAAVQFLEFLTKPTGAAALWRDHSRISGQPGRFSRRCSAVLRGLQTR